MSKNLALAVAVLALFVGVGGYFSPQLKQVVEQQFGATPGATLPDCTNQNGIETCSVTQSMTATSSSVCILANPFGTATTSVEYFSARISSTSPTGTGISVGANAFDLSTTTATGGYGSSTPAFIFNHAVAAAATSDTVVWTPQRFSSTSIDVAGSLFTDTGTAATEGVSPYFLAGSEKLTYRIASGTPRTFGTYYAGTCKAIFRKVP